MKNVRIIIILVFALLLVSCEDKPEQKADNELDLIKISKAQFESEKMVIGKPERVPFAEKVHFTGRIVPSVNGQAKISLPLPGIINSIGCKPAQKVTEGSILFEIGGHWFIDLQKDYAESSAILSKLESEYVRARELYEENIGSQKEYTAAKSSYYAENARHKALRKQLQSMGLNVAKIEEGTFYSSFPLKSPIRGYVSDINATLGQYVEPQQSIAEIIDYTSFQLELSVFEKDIHRIKPEQNIEFYFNGDKTQKHLGALNAIGKTIMPESKSINCYAIIDNANSINMVSNQYAEGEIFTVIDSIRAVPETALIESENNSYLLLYENKDDSAYYFKQIKVNTGRKSNNYIELTTQLPTEKILLSGIYNIVIE